MKELLRKTLANLPQKPYSNEDGDILMEVEGKDMPIANSEPHNVESTEKAPQAPKLGIEKPVSAERQAAARKAWEKFDELFNKGLALSVDERRVREQIIEKGLPPIGGGTQEPEEPVAGAAGADGGIEGPPAPPISGPEEQPQEPRDEPEEEGGVPSDRVGGERPRVTDEKAADLIAKFIQEGGHADREKRQQLRNDLSQRINELMKEQWALADSDEAQTPEGRARVDARIDELNDRISQIQESLVEVLRVPGEQEVSRRGDPLVGRLVRESDGFVRGLLGRGLKINEINILEKLTPGERAKRVVLVREIKEFLENAPSLESSSFDSDILFAARHFKELREQLISDIMFKSFEDRSETNEYEINLYADSNLNTLLGFMSKDDNERYRYFFSLRTATRFFQSMNATVLKGTFDSFGHSAENINYQHFENMRDIRGSGLAMRLYEQAYKDVLAEDKRVTQDRIKDIKEFVETTFKEINEAGLIKSEYAQYRTDSKMENWEMQRALAAGRSFLNITLRAAENIATGQVPSDRKRFTSPPQEDMVRILNWNQWLLARFAVGGDKAGRHGEEFLKMSTDRWEEFLKYKGAKLNVNKIAEFGGVDVRKMEEGGQYRTSGVYSGWRMENLAFGEIYFNYEGNRISVQKFRDMQTEDKKGVKDMIDAIKKRIEDRKTQKPDMDPKDLVNRQDQEEYRNILMPVVDNLNFGLSMLLKNGDFGAQDNKLGYLLRIEIWRKIARTNIPLMIDYLTDIKYAKDTPESEKAQSIEALRNTMVPEWKAEQWKDFRRKVLIRHERIIREGFGEEVPVVEDELNETEKQLITAIQTEGVKLAPHLADIVFPYMPFMNDMPFEQFNYAYLGQTFYKRRSTNDLGGFNKGQQAYAKILSNPGGVPVKDAVAAMGEIVAGVESPEGPRTAIESNFPTFSALLDVVTTDPWKRQAMFKMLLGATRTETSLAQRWAGIRADSFVESEAANLIDETTKAGILNPELARYLKKEKKLTLTAILWMLFRDVFVMVPIFAGAEFIGKLTKEK